MENSNHTCNWIISENGKFSDCNCHDPGTVETEGKWWCTFHAQAVTLYPEGTEGTLLGRVSTREQADNGYSLPTQIEESLKYAIAHRIRVLPEHTFIEDISGLTPISSRPEHRKALLLLKEGDCRAVVAHKVDRYSRDIVDLLVNVKQWIRRGVTVHATDIGQIKSELDIALVLQAWQGGDEHTKIKERLSKGMKKKAQLGEVVGAGRAPYGYRFHRDDNHKVTGLEVYETEAGVVRLIFQWYVNGDQRGNPLTLWAIARELTELRVPTPGMARGYTRGRNGTPIRAGIWSFNTIRDIITNETYAGLWHFGKRMGRGGKKPRPLDQQIAVKVPALVSQEIWLAAQSQREYNAKMSARNAKRPYLLRGMVKCSCGRIMTGCAVREGRGRYYRCMQNALRPDHKQNINADKLEEFVWHEIMGLLHDRERFEGALQTAQELELDHLKTEFDELATVEQMIAECDEEAASLAMAITKAKGIIAKHLDDQMTLTNARYDALVKRQKELQKNLGARHLTDEAIAVALRLRDDVIGGMKDATFEDKRQVFKILDVTAYVDAGQVELASAIRDYCQFKTRCATP